MFEKLTINREALVTTRLLQSFTAPPKPMPDGSKNIMHRVFGGGMMQMSKALWDALDEVCTVHYMGAAEYEFGILPTRLGLILDNNKNMKPGHMILGPHDFPDNYKRRRRSEGEELPTKRHRAVFYLCDEKLEEETRKRIKELASGKLGADIKMGCRFPEALDPLNEYDREFLGWLDLNNGFMFFVDEDMWRGFQVMLGIKSERTSPTRKKTTKKVTKKKRP